MIKASTRDAYKLLHDGSLVMGEMEANGLCVDTKYITRTQQKIQERIAHLTEQLKQDKLFKYWRRAYGSRTNLGSRTQLADVLFNVMKIPTENVTRTKTRYKADEDVLETLDLPFTKIYLQCEKLKKARNTYLNNILRETVNGIIHPNFNLHLVRTYRGSSDHPNFTNIPVKDPLIKKLIRRAFIARKGHCLVDLDFKGSEIGAAAWYHKDPMMLKYISDPKKDMHGDMGQQIYMLTKKQMTWGARDCAKNRFVFPQFYGDWWLACARNLWRGIDQMRLKTAKGMPMRKWLRQNGITSLGTGDPKNIDPESFEAHLKDVEHDFWNNRFSVYQDWKDDWWDDYQTKGFFRMLSGFIVSGNLGRKECINYPIQGTAFHCLLWCLIEISRLLKKYKMKALLVGQIHDDAVGDVPKKELKDYIDIALEVIIEKLPKHWPWIITPMRVEVEVTPIDGSWYQKKEYKL